MRLILGCLSLVLSCAMAWREYHFCDQCDAEVVKAQWNVIFAAPNSGASKYMLASHIFDRLFVVSPDAKNLFTRVKVHDQSSPEFQAHVVRVINGLDLCINSLTNRPLLESIIDHMATQHCVREGVTQVHFDVMEKVLFEMLPQALDEFDYDAWASCISPVKKAIARGLPKIATSFEW